MEPQLLTVSEAIATLPPHDRQGVQERIAAQIEVAVGVSGSLPQ